MHKLKLEMLDLKSSFRPSAFSNSIYQPELFFLIFGQMKLMPEGLLKDLTEQQVRDMFAYLRSSQPLP